MSGDNSLDALDLKRNYENLTNAIVLQAVQDYRFHQKKVFELHKALKHTKDITEKIMIEDKIKVHNGHIRSIKVFFQSDWFNYLTNNNVDGKWLFKKVRIDFIEEYRKNKNKRNVKKSLKNVDN